MSTVTLTEFLLARIAEDERDADCILFDYGQGNVESRAARVLAECEAKRRIVELHRPIWASDIEWADCAICPSALSSGGWPCPTLRALTLPYADHPDHREEWKP